MPVDSPVSSMWRIPLASLIVLAGMVRAAEVAPPGTPPRSGSIESNSAPAPKFPPKRAVSPETAAKLTAAVPKFTATMDDPPPEISPMKAGGLKLVPDMKREAETSRSRIIHLPEFVVGEPKVYLPNETQVLTFKGRVELAINRRPGLRIAPFAWLNAGIALEMLEEDLQAQRRAEAVQLLSLYLIQ